MSLPLGNMKLIKTESNQAIHLFQMLGVTEEQFKQAQDWYLSAQQDRKTNKTKTANKTD
jgi:hypothetical protein